MVELSLGHRIREARKKTGLSQEDLAKRLGITMNTVNRYEKSHRLPDANILNQMVDILNCDPAWLLTGGYPRKDVISEEKGIYNDVADDLNRKILLMLEDMPEDDRREILKHIQEKKLLKELIAERLRKKGSQ